MGNVEDDDEWEEKMARNFGQMQVTDEETGECWMTAGDQEPCVPHVDSSSSRKPGGCLAMKLASSWRVPKEYSLLGSSPVMMDCSIGASELPCKKEQKEQAAKETKAADGGEGQPLVVTMPTTGKGLFFCRKRRGSACKEPAKKTSDCFLEGREELRPYVLVGRLFFAFLVLLSPGVMFPFLLFIRAFCHIQRHNSCFAREEDAAAIVAYRHVVRPFDSFFGTHIKFSCRFCRENMTSKRMFRIHAQIGGLETPIGASGSPSASASNVQSPPCCCHDHQH